MLCTGHPLKPLPYVGSVLTLVGEVASIILSILQMILREAWVTCPKSYSRQWQSRNSHLGMLILEEFFDFEILLFWVNSQK